MVAEATSTTEKRGVVFTFLLRLLYNPNILCKFAHIFRIVYIQTQQKAQDATYTILKDHIKRLTEKE